jgi:hypothetical protein
MQIQQDRQHGAAQHGALRVAEPHRPPGIANGWEASSKWGRSRRALPNHRARGKKETYGGRTRSLAKPVPLEFLGKA